MLSFLFVEDGKLFIKKSSFEDFNLVFFTAKRIVCFEMQPGQQRGNFIYPMMHRFILYYQLPNARDPISSTRTRQLNNGGKRFVLPIKPSVPLMCLSIYDFRFTIPNLSLVKSKRVFWPRIIN